MKSSSHLLGINQYLYQLANANDFEQIMMTAFGSGINRQRLGELRQQWRSQDYRIMPKVEVLSQGELADANGAYATSLDTIFVSSDFLARADERAIANLLLEELGHKLDNILNNGLDSAGDEGAIFAALAQGQTLSSEDLASLRAENDHRVIWVNGQAIAVELENWTGDDNDNYKFGGTDSDLFYGLGGIDRLFGNDGFDSLNGGAGNDSLSGGDQDDQLHGDGENDFIIGDNGNDRVFGDDGNDTVSGGIGDDTVYGGNGDDSVLGNDGNDSLLGDQGGPGGNDTVSGGSGNDIMGGNDGNDSLLGDDGNDFIQGDRGNDTAIGGAGNDTLYGGTAGAYFVSGDDNLMGGDGDDFLNGEFGNNTLNGENGNDTIEDYDGNSTLLGGAGNDQFIGGAGNDQLDGDIGDDILNGGTGNDALVGGTGNDTYIVDATGDAITEISTIATEIDTVQSSITYSLGANLENLTLTGIVAINGTGNALNNTIAGNTANNILNGGLGNDTLIGGVDNDTLIGDTGDDTYVVNSTGNVFNETSTIATEIDTVQSSFTYSLGANLENLTLTGIVAINGTGNALNNTITGNTANNILNGGLGNDTLIGGTGNDTYVVDAIGDVVNEASAIITEIDIVQASATYSLTANLENLTLTGIVAINGTGNDLNNTITGNIANNILDGGLGNDTLIGGTGNDTYVVDAIGDVANESSTITTEIDTVQSSVTYALRANLENLTLTGIAAINGTGNASNNVLVGNAANNILNGLAGNDSMAGGDGIDIYYVDSTGDTISETLVSTAASEIDYVYFTATSYVLSANIERLYLLTGAVSATGNASNNLLVGNSADNILNGDLGNDNLIGGTGNDTYVVDAIGDVVNEASTIATEIDSVQSSVTYSLGANLEDLTLTGVVAINGTGNALNNIITGNTANNILNGGLGNDNLIGGTGNDTYVVDAVGDVVNEASAIATEIDSVQSSVTYSLGANVENLTLTGIAAINGTGNALNNTIIGNTANNILNGGLGNDTLIGGTGNDTYVVDAIGDVVNEASTIATEIDTVQSNITYSLGANLENLTLTGIAAINGTGNALNNTITGNTANNILNGGLGSDTLIGGTGNDIYVVDSRTDVVNETSLFGTEIDTVQSSITYYLGANLENLTLTGTAALNGRGNSLNNIMTGNSAGSTLSGGAGDDTLIGLDGGFNILNGEGGNDRIEDSDGSSLLIGGLGLDTIYGGAGVDQLQGNGDNDYLDGGDGDDDISAGTGNDTLYGGTGDDQLYGDISLYGEIGDDVMSGGDGNDTLIGGDGNDLLSGDADDDFLNGGIGSDTLTGGIGADTFVFQFGQSTATAADRLTDFAIGTDKIDLFTAAGLAAPAPTAFSRANDNTTATSLTTLAQAIFSDANGAVAGNQALTLGGAALVVVTGAIAGTYLIVDDGIAGFGSNDLVINISGVSGSLPSLGTAAVNSFFV
jgi:Ca2+-binding RTX toxin-like protein